LAKQFASVLIDTYNHERFIEKAIVSVLEQDFPASEREVIVVDDGSTDGTPDIVKKFEPRVRLLRKENGGQASAFNAGIPECKGEIVAFLDGDDWWAREKLRRVADVINSDLSIGMVGHGFIETYNNGDQRVIAEDQPKRLRLDSVSSADIFRCNRGYFGTSRLTLRAELARRILPVPEALVFEADEYVFTLGAALSEAIILNAALAYYRIHGANLFLCAGSSPTGERKKGRVLAALVESLRNTLPSLTVPDDVAVCVLEPVSAEAAYYRLKLDGGWSWETFQTETAIYRIQHRNEPWKNKIFRALTMVPALLLPPRWFYAGREWLGRQQLYKYSRKMLLPLPPVGKAIRREVAEMPTRSRETAS